MEGPQRVLSLESRLRHSVMSNVNKYQSTLSHLEEKIQLMKPENLLKKGYSLTMVNGKLIRNTSDLKVGDILQTQLFEGNMESRITKIGKK